MLVEICCVRYPKDAQPHALRKSELLGAAVMLQHCQSVCCELSQALCVLLCVRSKVHDQVHDRMVHGTFRAPFERSMDLGSLSMHDYITTRH